MVAYLSVLDKTANLLLLVLVVGLVANRWVPVTGYLDLSLLAGVVAVAILIPIARRGWRTKTDLAGDSADGWLSDRLGAPIDIIPEREFRLVQVIVVALMVWGFGLRLYALGDPSMWFDEAITTIAAIGFLERGTPGFPSGASYWRGFPHTALVAGSLAVFGVSDWAARVPSVVIGTATIPLVYWLGKETRGRVVGIVAAFVVTFLAWEIAWSRQARMYQLLQFAYALTLVGLLRLDRQGLGDRLTLVLVAGGTILAALTHRIGMILFPLSLGYLGYCAWRERQQAFRQAAIIFSIILVSVLAIEVFGGGPISAVLTVLGTQSNYAAGYHRLLSGRLGPVYALGIVGFALSFQHPRRGLLLAVAVLPPAWILAFHTHLFAIRYLYFAIPILAVYIGLVVEYGVVWLQSVRAERMDLKSNWRAYREVWRRSPTDAAMGAVAPLLVLTLILTSSVTFVPQADYALGPNAPQPDFESAHAYVDRHEQSGDVLIASWTAPAWYYHGRLDYWLVHALTETQQTWTTADGVEVYSGATPIETSSELQAVIDCHQRGWLVMDRIAREKMDEEQRDIVVDLRRHEVAARGMYVYSWDHQRQCTRNETSVGHHGGQDRFGPADDSWNRALRREAPSQRRSAVTGRPRLWS